MSSIQFHNNGRTVGDKWALLKQTPQLLLLQKFYIMQLFLQNSHTMGKGVVLKLRLGLKLIYMWNKQIINSPIWKSILSYYQSVSLNTFCQVVKEICFPLTQEPIQNISIIINS